MNKIGFKNFRRFKEFAPLEFKGITYLVGQNNTGKSTFVKALLLTSEYLNGDSVLRFPLSAIVNEGTGILTFKRALNAAANPNVIEFYGEAGDYSIRISLGGQDDSTVALVAQLNVLHKKNGVEFIYRPASRVLFIRSGFRSIESQFLSENSGNVKEELDELRKLLSTSNLKKTDPEYLKLADRVNALEFKLGMLEGGVMDLSKVGPKEESVKTFTYEYTYTSDNGFDFIVYDAVRDIEEKYEAAKERTDLDEEEKRKFENLENMYLLRDEVDKTYDGFMDLVTDNPVLYLGSYSARQSALFQINDKGNAVAQAIHNLYQQRIKKGEKTRLFIEKWMKAFDVGNDFEIIPHAGEAYEFKILSDKAPVHLADKGTGSIQAMLFILRIASELRGLEPSKTSAAKEDPMYPIFLIEEPELNLHPALQSKITDMLLEVYQEYGVRFIIETHSEYMIRRSQVLVSEKEFEVAPNENPFCVYYFPKDLAHIPYRLNYLPDGTFDKNFGEGFFDEASASTLRLIRLKREKKD